MSGCFVLIRPRRRRGFRHSAHPGRHASARRSERSLCHA